MEMSNIDNVIPLDTVKGFIVTNLTAKRRSLDSGTFFFDVLICRCCAHTYDKILKNEGSVGASSLRNTNKY